ncbi:nuclear pore membrane glycoprotein 210-like [Babylonia areolata]|uniref:nuclear pore membrane glycoprotein 210-like n=1 Tax=Babylonia areolata TaxID=304850 RepID=UPI003FD6B292
MAGTMGTMCKILLSICFLGLLSSCASGAKLNAPKVLLPYYSSVIANFTLEVEYSPEESQVANCYRWRSTRPEVAQVHLINSTDGECAAKARVSAISKTPHQMTTAILAENKVTKEILRCNVIVSEIVRLDIETTTRLLYLEDSPEELIARGYDSEGNIFSSLEGLQFEWSLVSDNEVGGEVVDAHNILRIKRFSESHYTTPPHIVPLEELGLQGDTILVEGIRTGSAKCLTRLKDPVYKQSVKPNEVRIMVIANLMLTPPDAYVLKHARVKYTVELLRHNSLKEITMPSPQYYLDVKDTTICTLDTKTSMATALEMGSTEIVLKDRNIVMTEFFRQPSAMLHVVSPGFLAFVVLPTRKWVLETRREYEIYIEVYDTDSHKIYPSDNVRVRGAFPKEYFEVLFSSENGTYHRVRTLLRGQTVIHGELHAVVEDDGTTHLISPEVKGNQDVQIYDPITVEPTSALFPWDPATQCQHNFTAKARGGSGEYVWGSSDLTTASVNFQGQITTVGPGRTNITAADAKNAAHTGTLSVHVLPPSAMMFPPSKVEAAVGTTLAMPLVVSAKVGGRQIDFTDCSQLPLNVTFTDTTVFERITGEKQVPDRGCRVLYLRAIRQGHTEVTVTYQSLKVFLQAAVTVAAYNPLKPVDPEQQAVVTVGSSKDLVFQGGPQPWVLDSAKFFHVLEPKESSLVSSQQAGHTGINRLVKRHAGGIHTFHVLCRDFGEQVLTLNVGNGVTAQNQFPVTERASVRVVCARPVELHLQPILTQDPALPPCPVTHETHLPMPVHCEKDLRLQVALTDSSGRRFDNFSSLLLEWSVPGSGLASVLHPNQLYTEVVTSDDGNGALRFYQTLRPEGRTGTVVVTATISGYKKEYLRTADVSIQEKISPRISKSLELLLVEEAVISPDTVSIFNHPSNKVMISVERGSGYFHLPQVDSQVMKASYVSKSKGVLISPLKDGSHSMTVYDLCLEVDSHPSATVYVSGVSSIHVAVIDKVEVGKEVTATVQVLDVHGHPLLSSFFTLMGLKLEPASDIVTLRPVEGPARDQVTAQYTVHGAVVGHTTLSATATLPNAHTVFSVPKPVEVFPPLRLEPKNITLIIGARFQVIAVGGPQPQSTVQFSIDNSDVSSVSSSGLLEALTLGWTRVVGRAVGVDPMTGHTIVYSQDDAIVNVVPLQGIRIYAPLSRLQTGTRMPVYAMGVTEHETPFSFGGSVPPLTFTWSVNSREVLHLESVYQGKGVRLPVEDSFSQQVVAEETGHVTVKLVVRAKDGSRHQLQASALRDDVQIQVFDKLQLTSPPACDGQIRLTPSTETFLKTNRDVGAVVSYRVVSEGGEEGVVRVDKKGQLVTGPIPGTAVVHVTAQEDFGVNQTLVLLVKVKPVSYLMLNLDTAMKTSGAVLPAVPVGTTLHFSVTYHDDVGETFFATNVQLGIRCSRYDLLHMSSGATNSSLVVRAAEVGRTTLKVWDKRNPWVADYISIPVQPAITPPHAVLALGSVLCFSSPLVTDKGETGVWHSSSSSVQVDRQTGVGRAVSVGHSVLAYTVSPDVVTNTEVTVVPVERMEVRPVVKYLTTNPDTSQFIPVTFTSPAALTGTNCTAPAEQRKGGYKSPIIPFSCTLQLTNHQADVSVSDIFSAHPVFDAVSGEQGCWVESVASTPTLQQVSTLQSSITLTTSLPRLDGQPEVTSDLLTLDLLPAFHVYNTELHLSTRSPLGSVRVATLPKVMQNIQVTSSDPTLVEVMTPETDPQSGAVVLYPVRLRDSLTLWEKEQLDLHVELANQRTGQKQRVPVSIKLIGQKPDIPRLGQYRQDVGWGYLLRSTLHNYQSWFVLLLIILVTGAAVLVGYHAVVGSRYKASATSNVFLNQSSASTSPSPHHFLQPPTSPGSPRQGSPKSPPRLWSVSYNQQDSSFSPLKQRPGYTSFT